MSRQTQNQTQKDGLLAQYLLMCQKAFAFNFLFSFFINILMLSTSIYSLQVLDRVLSSNSMETLTMLSIMMLVVYVILAFLQIIRSFIFTQISNWLDSKLSAPLLESSISFNVSTKGSQNLRDLSTIKSFITGQAITHLFDAPWAIIYFAVIFFIHWVNGFIVLGAAVILLILALINERMTKKQLEKSNEINMHSMRKVDSISRNAEVIKAMGMKGDITKSWQEINGELTKANTIVGVRSAIITNITKSIRLLVQMLVMAVGAVLVMKGKMSAGGIIATSILTGKALAPFDAAVTIYKAVLNSKKSYQRLKEVLKDNEMQEKEKIKLPDPKGEITLDKLMYKLPGTDQITIKGVNIKINAGEIIGVIGPSGCGKTTIARLIVGVLEATKGCVRVDGSKIQDQESEEIGKHIGYLPQDVELFNASIKDNIARMNKEVKDEDIIKAAQFSSTHELILNIPNAYEANAANLSAGQRQRIGLARAFLGNPKLVVLDEPNSNLDAVGEMGLLNTIKKAKEAKITTIIISHKPSILKSVDKILVLSEGEAKIFDERDKVIQSLSGGSNNVPVVAKPTPSPQIKSLAPPIVEILDKQKSPAKLKPVPKLKTIIESNKNAKIKDARKALPKMVSRDSKIKFKNEVEKLKNRARKQAELKRRAGVKNDKISANKMVSKTSEKKDANLPKGSTKSKEQILKRRTLLKKKALQDEANAKAVKKNIASKKSLTKEDLILRKKAAMKKKDLEKNDIKGGKK